TLTSSWNLIKITAAGSWQDGSARISTFGCRQFIFDSTSSTASWARNLGAILTFSPASKIKDYSYSPSTLAMV
ncbi:mCG144697, partial [Mus musculus]